MNSERRLAYRRVQDLVRAVYWRWRLRQGLRGVAWTAAIALSVLFLSAAWLERMRFTPEAVVWLRWLTWGALAVAFVHFLVRPFLKRVTDRQVALYLEEHEPTLEHTVVSALDVGSERSASPELSAQVVSHALERARRVEYGRRIEQSALYRFTGALSGVAVVGLVMALLGPTQLRHGLAALLLPTRDAASVNPYSVSVQPGNVTIARGSDQMVTATLGGFEASEASVFTRGEEGRTFQRLTMLPTDSGAFEMLLLGVDRRTEYFVESSGVRSATFTIDVADLPYVDQLDLTYYFPRYTGLQPRTVEDGGDVAALSGTLVEVRVHATMATPGGRLLMDGQPAEELEVAPDGTLVGRFTVRERGFYSIELARDNGQLVAASPEYHIDILTDQEPSIRFTRPGRDMPASPVEEVYLELSADDDYGVGDLRLVYSVNGDEEDTVTVFRSGGSPLSEASAGHTLFLEEWQLEPGDLVSYYGLVRDNRGADSKAVSTDIYFLNVRPFERAYRQAEQQGAGMGGQGRMRDEALSELQRQIIAATFNLIRQRDSYSDNEFSENVVSVKLTQERLRSQVETLVQRMRNRGLVESDQGFRDITAVLPQAAEAMGQALEDLEGEKLQDALPDEQSALRYLQQAEETYERYVVQQQGGGGGGGGQGQQAAEDLADLFELELDKLKNQYETVQRGQQQQADNEVDELLERLRELARRQEQEAERQRRRAQMSPQGTAGGSQSQRELAERTEEAARQLQRLAREMNDARLEETARDLQQAAESMRQAASQGGAARTAESGSALDRLEEARRQLEEARADRARRDAQDAIQRVEELQRQQREVQREVRELPQGGTGRTEEIQRLRERKNQMTEAVADLERQLDASASGARADNPEAARRMQDAANHIRESKLKEKLQYSRGTIEQWDPQAAVTLELTIEADLQGLRDRLEEAASAATSSQRTPLEEALDDARELVRGMEAMDRRLREPGPGEQQGEQQGQAGQQGQQGQQGQTDQEGQAGQQGQQGQGGQQGQEGQGGRQGQTGQQGQAGQQGGQRGGEGGDRRLGGYGPDGVLTPGEWEAPYRGGGPTRGDPQPLTPEEIRQFRREFGERREQARELRDRLAEADRSVADLQAVLDAMRRLEQDGVYDDPTQVAALQEEILRRLKALEFGLRREVEGEVERRPTLSGGDEVPEGYRRLVEEYYRALARGGSGP